MGTVKVPPQEAKRLKETLRLAYVVKAKEPFFITGKRKVSFPKFSFPFDIDEDFFILFADFQCGLVIDEQGKAIASFVAGH